MEAKLVIKADEVTADFIDGIKKVFSANAMLDIVVSYESYPSQSTEAPKRGRKPGSINKGAKRGPKPKNAQPETPEQAPKKRGRKPKVAAEPINEN